MGGSICFLKLIRKTVMLLQCRMMIMESALSGEESKYKQSLNGKWKFYWQRGLRNQPTGFERMGFNDSDWDEINVPLSGRQRGILFRITMQALFRER